MNPIFALALACFGVSLAEGFLMANLLKQHLANQKSLVNYVH